MQAMQVDRPQDVLEADEDEVEPGEELDLAAGDLGRDPASAIAAPRRRRYNTRLSWGSSSAGRAPRSQRGGRGFESLLLHQ
jgi:hypothetical protein